MTAKNDSIYNSTLSVDGMNIFETTSSYPLIKYNELSEEVFTPKISFRLNPWNNMTDNRSSSSIISANNIFDINRLGLSDTFEAGKSVTLGLDYKIDLKQKNSI